VFEDLQLLATNGFAAVPPLRFGELADACWDWCEATGDGRFCSLARTLSLVSQWWSEYEAVPTLLSLEIEREFILWLGDVLDSEDLAAGAMSSRCLRQAVIALLLPPQRWDQYRNPPQTKETT
jgi:hypothetical protein